MENTIIVLFLFICSTLQTKQNGDYILDAGVQIRILVYEPDLTVEWFITNDGKINFPLIGSIYLTGKTTRQVQKLIHNGLKGDYLLNPSVQVDIITYRPFYIHGEVNRPGAYPDQPGLTVDQTVALGGGFTERESTSKMYIKKAFAAKKSRKKYHLPLVLDLEILLLLNKAFSSKGGYIICR